MWAGARFESGTGKENQMSLLKWLATSVALVGFGLSSATAADKAKQEEVLKATQSALADFYKAQPSLKAKVEKAPGYAVFTTYGISFIFGGAGGKGVVHDNATKVNTFMDMAAASAGLQISASETRYLFVFKDKASMQQFIDNGWDASANVAAGAGTGKKEANAPTLGKFTGGDFYRLTKAGFEASVAGSGIKVWKDKELN
jgi:lipid-binding SYLF domain-containing protein